MPHLFGDCSNYYRYVVQRFKNAARNDKWDFFKFVVVVVVVGPLPISP